MKTIKSISILIVLMTVFGLKGFSQDQTELKVLDSNNDGIINPWEALDVLLQMEKEHGENLSIKDMTKITRKYEEAMSEEMEDIMKELDANKDNQIEFGEVENEEFLFFLAAMDSNEDEKVTMEEMLSFNIENAFFMSDKQINKEIKAIFKEFKAKDELVISMLPDSLLSDMAEWDLNHDGTIHKDEAFKAMKYNNMPAAFEVKNGVAYMSGVIGSGTPAAVLELIFNHPEVKTIEMINVPGSIDDVSNLRASLYINRFGFNIRLNKHSIIASGGTDFFLAGKQRKVEKSAKIGVHSWGGGTEKATDLPKSDKAHKKYLSYYNQVGIPEAFYWYTLEAAPAESIHYMTESEIETYQIRTK